MIDQRYLVSWNNKQARGFASSDTNAFSSAYRSQLLSDRVRKAIRGERKLDLPGLIDIMEVAGTGDLRAHVALPLALRIIGRPSDAGCAQRWSSCARGAVPAGCAATATATASMTTATRSL